MHPGVPAFAARFAAEATDAHAAVRLLVEAMVVATQDAVAGDALLCVVCSKDLQSPDPKAPGGQRLRDRELVRRLVAAPAIATSLAGARAADGYTWDGVVRVAFDAAYSANQQGVDWPEPGRAKLFLVCGGADRPRPVELRRNAAGLWKVVNFGSLTVGVARPSTGDF